MTPIKAIVAADVDSSGTIIDSLGRSWDPLEHPRGRDGRFIRVFHLIHMYLGDGGSWGTGEVVQINKTGSVKAKVTAVTKPEWNNYIGKYVDVLPGDVSSVNEKAILPGNGNEGHTPLGTYNYNAPNMESFFHDAGFSTTGPNNDLSKAADAANQLKHPQHNGQTIINSNSKYHLALYAHSQSGNGMPHTNDEFAGVLQDLGVDPKVIDDTPDGMTGLKKIIDEVNFARTPEPNMPDSPNNWVEKMPLEPDVIREAQYKDGKTRIQWHTDGSVSIIGPDGTIHQDDGSSAYTSPYEAGYDIEHGQAVATLKTPQEQPQGGTNDQIDYNNPQAQYDAMEAYTEGGSGINDSLREPTPGEEPGGKYNAHYVKTLDGMMAPVNTTAHPYVYRGVKDDGAGQKPEWVKNLEPGSVIQDLGYMSTTDYPSVAEDFIAHYYDGNQSPSAFFQIKVPKGAKAIDVNGFYDSIGQDNSYSHEHEHILPRGTQLEVTGVYPHEGPSGSTLIEAIIKTEDNNGGGQEGQAVGGLPEAPNVGGGPGQGDSGGTPSTTAGDSGKSPFEILADPGKSGDGYYATNDGSHFWGKYGAAGVMVRNTDDKGVTRYLMVQRGPIVSSNKGKWQLPGGALNSNENDYQGTARELWEELKSPDGWLDHLQPVGEVNFQHPSGWHYNNIAADSPTMFDPKVDGTETGAAGWFTKEQIAQLPLHPALEKNLADIYSKFPEQQTKAELPGDYKPGPTSPSANLPEPPPFNEPLSHVEQVGIPIDASHWSQVGGQMGSNKGGMFEDSNGNKWYVKSGKTPGHAKNEVLASELYKAAGIKTADLHLAVTPFQNKLGTASPEIPGAHSDLKQQMKNPDYQAKLRDGFATDVWLANWDVAGLVYDNIMTDSHGDPVRIDPGGALFYRAQGQPKGGAFGDMPNEMHVFKDPSMSQAAAFYKGMSWEEEKASMKHVLDVSPGQIDDLVNSLDFTGTDINPDMMKHVLKARREALADYYGLNLPENHTDVSTVALPHEDVPAADVTPQMTANLPDSGDVYKAPPGVTDWFNNFLTTFDDTAYDTLGHTANPEAQQGIDTIHEHITDVEDGNTPMDYNLVKKALDQIANGTNVESDLPSEVAQNDHYNAKAVQLHNALDKLEKKNKPKAHLNEPGSQDNGGTDPLAGFNPDSNYSLQIYDTQMDQVNPYEGPNLWETADQNNVHLDDQDSQDGSTWYVFTGTGYDLKNFWDEVSNSGDQEFMKGLFAEDNGSSSSSSSDPWGHTPPPEPQAPLAEPGPYSTDWQNMHDNNGEYRWGAGGEKLYIGDTVKSLTDGQTGTIVKFEKNHKGIIIKGEDGKKKARKNDTLQKTGGIGESPKAPAAPETAQPQPDQNILEHNGETFVPGDHVQITADFLTPGDSTVKKTVTGTLHKDSNHDNWYVQFDQPVYGTDKRFLNGDPNGVDLKKAGAPGPEKTLDDVKAAVPSEAKILRWQESGSDTVDTGPRVLVQFPNGKVWMYSAKGDPYTPGNQSANAFKGQNGWVEANPSHIIDEPGHTPVDKLDSMLDNQWNAVHQNYHDVTTPYDEGSANGGLTVNDYFTDWNDAINTGDMTKEGLVNAVTSLADDLANHNPDASNELHDLANDISALDFNQLNMPEKSGTGNHIDTVDHLSTALTNLVMGTPQNGDKVPLNNGWSLQFMDNGYDSPSFVLLNPQGDAQAAWDEHQIQDMLDAAHNTDGQIPLLAMIKKSNNEPYTYKSLMQEITGDNGGSDNHASDGTNGEWSPAGTSVIKNTSVDSSNFEPRINSFLTSIDAFDEGDYLRIDDHFLVKETKDTWDGPSVHVTLYDANGTEKGSWPTYDVNAAEALTGVQAATKIKKIFDSEKSTPDHWTPQGEEAYGIDGGVKSQYFDTLVKGFYDDQSGIGYGDYLNIGDQYYVVKEGHSVGGGMIVDHSVVYDNKGNKLADIPMLQLADNPDHQDDTVLPFDEFKDQLLNAIGAPDPGENPTATATIEDLKNIRDEIPTSYTDIVKKNPGISVYQAKQYRNAGFALDDAMKAEPSSDSWNKSVEKALYNLNQAGPPGAKMKAKLEKWHDTYLNGGSSSEAPSSAPSLGPDYAPLPEGAKPLFKYIGDMHSFDGQYIVEHSDGTLYRYNNNGIAIPAGLDKSQFETSSSWENLAPEESTTVNLGPGYLPLPDGAVPKYIDQHSGVVAVQHADGSWHYYGKDGSTAKVSVPNPDEYHKNAAGWVPYSAPQAGSTASSTSLDLGPGYAKPPAGSTLMYKSTAGGDQLLGVKHPDGTMYVYNNQGHKWEAGNPEHWSPQYWTPVSDSGASAATATAEKIDLGPGYAKLPDGAVPKYITSQGVVAVEHPDGTWHYYDKFGSTVKVSSGIESTLMHSPTWKVYTPGHNDGKSVAEPLNLPKGYATPPAGSKATHVFEADNGDKTYLVEHPDGTKHLYYKNSYVAPSSLDQKAIDASPKWHKLEPGTLNPVAAEAPAAPAAAPQKTGPSKPDAQGNALYIGDKVKTLTDGGTGTIVGFESGGKPGVKVKMDGTGKVSMRHSKKLKSLESGATPHHQDAVPPAPKKPFKPAPKKPADPNHPLYGTEKPVAPKAPDFGNVKYVDDAWMKKADENYKKRMKAKNANWTEKPLSQSSTYSQFVEVQTAGSIEQLDTLLSQGRITQEMYNDAKSQILKNQIPIKEAHDKFIKALEEHKQKLKDWYDANGAPTIQLLGFDDPEILRLNNSQGKAYMNKHHKPGALSPTGSLSAKQASAVSAQKSSNISHWLREHAKQNGLDPAWMKANAPSASKLKQWEGLQEAIMASPALEKPMIVTRTFDQHAFVNPDTKEYFPHGSANAQNLNSIVGSIQGDWGFAETSASDMDAGGSIGYQAGDLIMHLLLPAGTRGVWTQHPDQSFWSGNERGFILEQGMLYYIHSVEKKGGSWHVYAEIIPKEVDYEANGYFQDFNPFFD